MQSINTASFNTAIWTQPAVPVETAPVLKKAASHINLTDGAMEMKLVMLSIELSEIIDKLLKGRMQSQKDRNGQIEAFNDLQNALRKLEKSTDSFNAAMLDKPDQTPPPGSQMQQKSIERMREKIEKGKAAATAQAQAIYREVLVWSGKNPGFGRAYRKIMNNGYTSSMTVSPEGDFLFWNKDNWVERLAPASTTFYPAWGKTTTFNAYNAEKAAIQKCDDEFNAFVASGKVSLNDMLIDYGVYKQGDKMPATKEDLEAATEKISSMVNSINSVQTMKMLDINKFTNGRNEAYDLAVKVNTTKFDSLNALIRMIGDR